MEHFHVHGAHDHELEHKAQAGEAMAQYIAIFTAVLATIGAFVSYLGGNTQNEALYYKNDAVLKKTEASDQWNFYQAKSNKAHLMELAIAITPPDKHDLFQKELERYQHEKQEIKAKAEQLEQQSKHSNELSEHALHPHHRLAQAMTLIQAAIALASITVLTRKMWLMALAGAGALGGVTLAILAYV